METFKTINFLTEQNVSEDILKPKAINISAEVEDVRRVKEKENSIIINELSKIVQNYILVINVMMQEKIIKPIVVYNIGIIIEITFKLLLLKLELAEKMI